FAGVSTHLPLFLLNGAHDGPTVVMTGGVHGAEYTSIETAYRVARDTDPRHLHGQLIIAPIASMTAFRQRAIDLCPPDDKNLNRLFPGDPHGSFAQQLAHWLFQNLIRRADAFIDLHGGDLNEALVPFSIIRRSGTPDLDAKSLALAQAFGLPYIVESVVGGSTYAAATEAGIPAVLAEVGGQGLWPAAHVQQMVEGVYRALAHLELVEQAAVPIAPPSQVLGEMVWLRSARDGLFYPSVNVGDEVVEGQTLGRLADYLGETLEEVKAPASGPVLFLVTTLAMNNGDPLLAVGRVR
ncbi:MAG: succinylglutamate desuccinylase/aspartoacylase family protein, partial [Anaerolineae bacterium]|nr:succinylglutamate desuccinylase/aspartoacylase family protein [Anaerolineae bacterium]